MNRRDGPRAFALGAVATILLGAAPARAMPAGEVDTILRRPADPVVAANAPTDEPPARARLEPPAMARGAPPSLAAPILGGVLGGAIGLFGGAYTGLVLNDGSESEWDEIGAAITGGLAGEALLLPLGAHLGNRRRGSFASDLGVSILGGLAGIGVIAISGGHPGGFVLGCGLQLGLVVAQERAGDRARSAREAPPP